ncbi:hypothetical protein SAMN04487886_10188 [Clostridium sp. DSM 8431]|uniref:TcaA 3rd/4th domain-containing protein n=1 Tax=Clostridium sp. DSM 8431 TaxID=1761781 RepID=UPI0008E70AE8|nr:hypothetical protein [Clostridium sp. DSM 8431]SFU39307.1 hypothetical protein SAMN04487886_10188 [Clostridium sp. DSM 8431]
MRNSIEKHKFKIFILLFFTLALFFGYMFGRINNNRDRVLSKLEVALKNCDAKDLSKVVTLNNKRLSKDKVEPLIKYYERNTQSIDNDIKLLKSGMETPTFYIGEKKGTFGTNYYVNLKTYDVSIFSNYDDGEFTVDNKNYINANESLGNMIPGVYNVIGILKSEYGDIEASKEITLVKNEKINVDFDAVNITIKSKFKDADIFINNEKINMTVGEGTEIGPLRNDGTVSIYIEKEFPWGIIKSNEVFVSDIPVINLNINMENDDVKNDISDAAENFYKSVFSALNNENKSYIECAKEPVKDKIYDILEKKYTFLKNRYIIDNIEVVKDKSEYIFEDDKYKANVVVNVSYSTEKRFFGLSKEENFKIFFTKFVYDEENNEWLVSDVENFSL